MYKKKQHELKWIEEGGKKLGEILRQLETMVRPGVSAWDIDQEAEKLIRAVGGVPAFKGYKAHRYDPPFPSTICASRNEEVVHGIATKDKILHDGDIFSIDIGMQYPAGCGEGKDGNGYFTDTALTVPVGTIPETTKQLLAVTKKALEIGIAAAVPGNTVAEIGRAIEDYVAPQGYGIVRDLVGHGVGHAVHEDPRVPNYYEKDLEQWEIVPGVVLALEPMITMKGEDVETAADGWSISTVDKSLSAHFEHTIIITEEGPVVVTRRVGEKV